MGVRDLTEFESWPFAETGSPRALDPPVDVEPPRHGEGGEDCTPCARADDDYLWVDDDWRLTLFEPSPFLGVVLLEPRAHVESIAQLPADLAAGFGPMVGRVQRAITSLGGIGNVHVNCWGDGGAHLHVWFYPRPYGQLQLRGTFLPVWGFALPDRPVEQTLAAGRRIADALRGQPDR
ncbi:MAG: hypothetical protein JJT89_15360 [Nitriliruptoraceae bacterium]|nr:hypothetical protein [Nitriliruptoraceae bacterium]